MNSQTLLPRISMLFEMYFLNFMKCRQFLMFSVRSHLKMPGQIGGERKLYHPSSLSLRPGPFSYNSNDSSELYHWCRSLQCLAVYFKLYVTSPVCQTLSDKMVNQQECQILVYQNVLFDYLYQSVSFGNATFNISFSCAPYLRRRDPSRLNSHLIVIKDFFLSQSSLFTGSTCCQAQVCDLTR